MLKFSAVLTLVAAIFGALAPAHAQESNSQAKPPQAAASAASQSAPNDYSQAEVLLLMTDQMAGQKPGTQLIYHFKREGRLEKPLQASIPLRVSALPDGACCTAQADFVVAGQKLDLPSIEKPQGNPITLYFLERDIREMNRFTKGSARYFQKRIRMALYQAATVREVAFAYQGKPVRGQEIVIHPYRDDPNSARFEDWLQKQYRFVLSAAVPGQVAAISTRTEGAPGQPLMHAEQLLLDGVALESAAPAAASSSPSAAGA